MKPHEIFDKLTQDGRRLRVGHRLPEGQLDSKVITAVRDDLRLVLDQEGVTLDKISAASGISPSHLHRFIKMETLVDFAGDAQATARRINTFLELVGRRKEAQLPEGFVRTDVARRMLTLIGKTIELCSIGIIQSDAGRGKTMTMQAARMIYPGSILIRVRRGSHSAGGLCRQMLLELSLKASKQIAYAEAKLIDHLRGTGRALLIDEAHGLSEPAFELLRDLHDECGVPIVLAGTLRLSELVAASDVFSGQFSSRVALRYDVTEDLRGGGGTDPKPVHSADEIRKLFESDKVRLTDDGRRYLTGLANLPGFGGLRLCAKLVQVTASIMHGKPLDAATLRGVLASMHGKDFALGQVETGLKASRLKIA